MDKVALAGRILKALTVYLFGLAFAMGAVTLFVVVGWNDFGLRGAAMLAFSMIGVIVGVPAGASADSYYSRGICVY